MKVFVKFVCILVIVAFATLSFVSCGVITGDTVMEYEGYKITEAMYSYWKSHYVAWFMYNYSEKDADGNTVLDWDKELPNGSTYEQYFENEMLMPYVKKVLICQKLYDDYGLSLSEETEQGIADNLEMLKDLYGGSNGLNSYLSDYGLNAKTLEVIYYAEAKVEVVTDYIFGDSGPNKITTAQKKAYYEANYYCVDWIYIYTEKKLSDASDGNNEDSTNKLVDMTEAEKAEKAKKVEECIAKLKAGEKMSALREAYNEDTYEDGTSKYDYYPNGFNISANDYDNYGTELIKLVSEMEIGDIKTYTDGVGTRIIVRNELVEYNELTEQEKNMMVDFDDYVKDVQWEKIVGEAEIKVYSEVADKYIARTVKPFTSLAI